MGRDNRYHSSSHGAVLSCIAAEPDCTVNDLSNSLFLTRRTVWGIIGDLRRAGMVHVRKSGRRHHYSVNLEGSSAVPVLNVRRSVLSWTHASGKGASDRE